MKPVTTTADSEFVHWDTSRSPPRLAVRGKWTLGNYVALGEQIARLRAQAAALPIAQTDLDLSGLEAVDTAGASRLYELFGEALGKKISSIDSGLSPERNALL